MGANWYINQQVVLDNKQIVPKPEETPWYLSNGISTSDCVAALHVATA